MRGKRNFEFRCPKFLAGTNKKIRQTTNFLLSMFIAVSNAADRDYSRFACKQYHSGAKRKNKLCLFWSEAEKQALLILSVFRPRA